MFKKCKRGMTVLLAAVMLLTTMLPLTASAASGVTMDLTDCHVSWDYTLTDEEGNTFSAAYGLRAADDIYFNKGFSPYLSRMHDYTAKRKGLTGSKADWEYGRDYVYCFCIERGIPLPDNTQYSASENPNHGNKYALLTENQKDLLRLALTYGYPNRVGLQTSKDANACYAATQLIVWQITMGFRSSATALNDKTYPMSGYSGTMTEQYTRNKYLKAYYDGILSDMATHYTRPSFTAYTASAAKTFEMDYSGGRYTVTLTDTNRVLQNYAVTVSGGASVSVNGNTLTVSSVKPLNDEITVKLNRRVYSTNMSTGFLIWSVPGKESANQDMVSGVPADNDPVPSYLKVRTAAGSAKIVKVSEDGKVDGITFRIQGNGIDKTVKTANGGVIQVDNLRPGVYTVTEAEYDKYVPQETRRVTVVSGQVTRRVSCGTYLSYSASVTVYTPCHRSQRSGVHRHLQQCLKARRTEGHQDRRGRIDRGHEIPSLRHIHCGHRRGRICRHRQKRCGGIQGCADRQRLYPRRSGNARTLCRAGKADSSGGMEQGHKQSL